MAKKAFEDRYKVKVCTNGLFLSLDGLLGASPDGVLDSATTIEIKCPYKWRNANFKVAAKEKQFFLEDTDSGLQLRKNHNYYHQIQGQLYLSNRQLCYLIVWGCNSFEVIPIKRQEDWRPNLDRLKEFATSKFLPFALSIF